MKYPRDPWRAVTPIAFPFEHFHVKTRAAAPESVEFVNDFGFVHSVVATNVVHLASVAPPGGRRAATTKRRPVLFSLRKVSNAGEPGSTVSVAQTTNA